MIGILLSFTFSVSSLCLGLSMLFSSIRMFLGPTAQDRVLALDALYNTTTLVFLLFSMRFGTVYFDLALLTALVGFVGTLATAKFLLRGEVIE